MIMKKYFTLFALVAFILTSCEGPVGPPGPPGLPPAGGFPAPRAVAGMLQRLLVAYCRP